MTRLGGAAPSAAVDAPTAALSSWQQLRCDDRRRRHVTTQSGWTPSAQATFEIASPISLAKDNSRVWYAVATSEYRPSHGGAAGCRGGRHMYKMRGSALGHLSRTRRSSRSIDALGAESWAAIVGRVVGRHRAAATGCRAKGPVAHGLAKVAVIRGELDHEHVDRLGNQLLQAKGGKGRASRTHCPVDNAQPLRSRSQLARKRQPGVVDANPAEIEPPTMPTVRVLPAKARAALRAESARESALFQCFTVAASALQFCGIGGA
eukprot:CAMPEP_0185480566 /NCGR_PEP_ID=MMETSP1366-20130426/6368_1 /TAXON_ID=38817 /ORGANISM="Gephyrocapsa oceanica, Strain RCC1303" /LENGTH=262 /DNA_ID=CAMNT_0028088131 /DNA_START=637 /DNA_END=1427 /DNA_ORIENTATION=+